MKGNGWLSQSRWWLLVRKLKKAAFFGVQFKAGSLQLLCSDLQRRCDGTGERFRHDEGIGRSLKFDLLGTPARPVGAEADLVPLQSFVPE